MDALLRSISGSLHGSGVDGLLLPTLWSLLLLPVVVVVHELGHATVGLLCSEGLVGVQVGRGSAWWRGRIGRLAFELRPLPVLAGNAGLTRTFARLSPGARVAHALAGPIASGLGALVVLPFYLASTSGLRVALGAFVVLSLLAMLGNLLPFTSRSGLPSDGLVLVRCLQALREPRPQPALDGSSIEPLLRECDDTSARWLVLYSDEASRYRTEWRARVLACVQVVVGHSHELASPTATGLRSLAFAGWCWREVERGDSNRVRESVLEVSRKVVGAGYTGLQRTVRTAWGCSEPDAPLAEACPGRTPEERKGFLARAFASLPESVRVVPGVDEDVCRRAFNYGVALHDVERLSPLEAQQVISN